VASSRPAVCAAPADYAELFLQYASDIRRVVYRQLGPVAQPADVDEGVQYIVQQCMPNEKRPGVIEQYRPDHVSDFNHRPVTFKAFLMAKVALYCRGLHETLGKRAGRELLLVDTRAGDDGSMPWLDLLGGTTDEYPSLADGEALSRLRAALAAFAPVPGSEPVLPLFDALAGQFTAGRTVSAAAVRRKFGKTRDQADAWMGELHDALRSVTADGALNAPEPAIVPGPVTTMADDPWIAELRGAASGGVTFRLGGLLLSAAEVRAAVAALKGAKGNRVLPAFAGTGHRLAGAGKTWYLEFAEEVMQAYPELRTPVKRHAEGHFGRVKQALIFGLERFLDAVPVAEAVSAPVSGSVPEVTAMPSAALWADLESVLTRFPGLDGDRMGAVLETVRLLSLESA
jgi:hypothetical protein